MIAFLICIFVLWLIWRWLTRLPPVLIEPPPPAVTVFTPSIVVHVHLTRRRD